VAGVVQKPTHQRGDRTRGKQNPISKQSQTIKTPLFWGGGGKVGFWDLGSCERGGGVGKRGVGEVGARGWGRRTTKQKGCSEKSQKK